MEPSIEVLNATAEKLKLLINPNYTNDYVSILSQTDALAREILELPDYVSSVDLQRFPRTDIHFPAPADNKLNGWYCKATVNGSEEGTLRAMTIVLKDNICLAGVPCQFGTNVIQDYIPTTDATVVTRALENGGVIVGKANCEVMCHTGVSFSSSSGIVDNPYAVGFSTGGSSSGCGALIGSGEVDLGIGGDQGGSIRIPAALCGIVGLKPTFGLVPYTGIISSEGSLDHTGPMARDVRSTALLLQAIAGYDGLDDRQLGAPLPDALPNYIAAVPPNPKASLNGVKIGVLTEGFLSPYSQAIVENVSRSAIEKFKLLGAEIHDISIPLHLKGWKLAFLASRIGSTQTKAGRPTGRRGLHLNDFTAKLLPWDAAKWDKAHLFVQTSSLSGEYALDEYPTLYGHVMNNARRLQVEYDEALRSVDVLVMPTVAGTARRHAPQSASPLECVKLASGLTDNTAPFDITGHPALTFPVGFGPPDENDIRDLSDSDIRLPIGLQVVGRMFDEEMCFRVAGAWEAGWDWKSGSHKLS